MTSAQPQLAALVRDVPAEVEAALSVLHLHVRIWPRPMDSRTCSHKQWITTLLKEADRFNHHFGIQWQTPVAPGEDDYWMRTARDLPYAASLDDEAAHELMGRVDGVCGQLADPLRKLSDGEYYTTYPGDEGPPSVGLWFYGGNKLHVEVSHEFHYDTEPRDLHLLADILDLFDQLCNEVYDGNESLMSFELETTMWKNVPEPRRNPLYRKWNGEECRYQAGLFRIETGRLNTPETHERIKDAIERFGWNPLSRERRVIPSEGIGGTGSTRASE